MVSWLWWQHHSKPGRREVRGRLAYLLEELTQAVATQRCEFNWCLVIGAVAIDTVGGVCMDRGIGLQEHEIERCV